MVTGSSLTKSMFVPDSPSAYKVYEQKNAIQKDHTLGSYFIDEEKYRELSGFKVEPNDIIVSCAGTIGETYIMPNDIREGIINQALMLIRLHLKDIQDFYLLYFDFILKAEAAKESKGTAIKNIPPFDVLKSFLIPIPPLAEQGRILEEVNKMMSFVDSIDVSTKDISSLINSAKSKILDLAIHGKLVQQDANDEPASELLKRINPKAVASCDNPHYENVPFEIPSSWAWCKVRDVADVARGGSPRPIKQYLTDSPDGVNWIKIGDAEEGSKYITKTAERIIPEGAKRSRYVKTGDFLLTNSMSFGKPYILGTDGCIHDGWLVISPTDGAYDKNFLYYLLSSSFAYNQFSEKAGGAVVSNLNKDKVSDSLFPLPPIAEQKRIADMIEKLYKNLEIIASTLL